MKNTILQVLFCSFFISLNVKAQYSISGSVASESSEFPIEYLNVKIMNATDSTFMISKSFQGTNFTVKEITQPNVVIRFSTIGFEDLYINKKLESSHTDLGNIYLKELILDEVVITVNRPLIRQTAEGLIFDVANSYYAQGFDGVELLSRTPNIQMSESSINMVGRSGVLVLINGKHLQMDNKQLVEYIRTLDSRNISKIVVSSNPSAKYDAQGNSGVVNLILKREDGFNADLSFTYIKAAKNTFNPSAGFSYSNKKLYANLNVSSFWEKKVYESDLEYLYQENKRTTSTDRTDETRPDFSSNLSIDYQLTSRSTIGAFSVFNKKKGNAEYISTSYYSNYKTINKALYMPSYAAQDNDYFSIYPYWDFKIDSLGRKLQLEGGYVKSKSDENIKLSEYAFENEFEHKLDSTFSVNNSLLEYDLYMIKGDLLLPFQKYGTLEIGAKSVFIRNSSKREAFHSNKSFEEVANRQEDRFKINEDIFAVYASHALKLSEKLDARIGLRYEHTSNKNSLSNKKTHGDFFPSVSFAYKINDQLYTNIGYNKRLNRPGISQVNPFRWYTNSIDYTTGNMDLKPEIMRNIDLGLSYKTFSTNMYATFLNDGIQYIAEEVDSKGYSNYPINTLKESKLGITFNYYWMPLDRFSVFSTLNLYLYKLKSNFSKHADSSTNGNGGSLMMAPSYTLSRKSESGIDLMLMYSLPESNKIKYNGYYFFWGIRYKHSFLNNNLKFALTINDPWKWAVNKNRNIYTDFTFKSRLYNDSRSVKISISYIFSNNKLRNVNRRIDKSDENRIK